MSVTLLHGDCREVLATLAPESVDSIVTDPPAGIGFMGKDWDGDKGGRDEWVAWLAGVMREALRALKPGGHALVWALPRTSHWTATALEDAGFEVRDVVMHLFGTGFPKSLNVVKAGAGEEWQGWGTALKPAAEHWILARKPLVGTVATNVLAHGTGALNIDGCRIGGNVEEMRGRSGTAAAGNQILGAGIRNPDGGVWEPNSAGRWPANVTLDEEAAAVLDAQSGHLRAGESPAKRNARNGEVMRTGLGAYEGRARIVLDAGGASRFFYVAKPSRRERGEGNAHPTVKPVALMRWLVRLVTPPGGLVLDPFAGSGTTGLAAQAEGFRFLGVEREAEYLAIARQRLGPEEAA